MYRSSYRLAARPLIVISVALAVAVTCMSQALLAEDLPSANVPTPDISTDSQSATNATNATTIEARARASSDDAEETSGKSVTLNSSDLELVHDNVDQTVGLRWTGLAIPKG